MKTTPSLVKDWQLQQAHDKLKAINAKHHKRQSLSRLLPLGLFLLILSSMFWLPLAERAWLVSYRWVVGR